MDFFDPEAVQEDEEETEEDNGWRDNVLVLVDAQPNMLEPLNSGALRDKAFAGCRSWLEAAIKVCAAIIRTKIIEGAVDNVGIAFYNTEKSFNALGVNAVFIEQDMFECPPNAERVLGMEQLTQEKFLQRIGMGRSDEESRSLALDSALWVASSVLPAAPTASKSVKQHRVLLLTRDDCPATDPAIIQQRARNIAMKGATLQLGPLAGPDDEFDWTRFWETVLLAAPPTLSSNLNDEGETILTASSIDDVRDQILSMPALASVVCMRAYRKRSISRLSWALGPGGPVIGVRLYALIQAAWPAVRGPPTWLHAADYCKLELDKQPIDTMTGIPLDTNLDTEQPRLYYPKIDRGNARVKQSESERRGRRFPKIYLDSDEVAALKWPVTKGMSLLAFRPIDTLRPWHQLRQPNFCYPDEHGVPGSFRAFVCLHAAMLEREVYAVCAFVRTSSSEPRLVAAVPQGEVRDEGGAQITPPGFHLIHLPYSDDVRYPESDVAFTGSLQEDEVLSDSVLHATDRLLDCLQVPSNEAQDFIDIPNPHVQRWFQVLEGVVLREAGAIRAVTEIGDDCLDDTESQRVTLADWINTFRGIEDAEDAAEAFVNAVCGANGASKGVLTGKSSSKRPFPVQGLHRAGAKTVSKEDVRQNEEVDELARQGRLAYLTVSRLKNWLGEQGLPKTGRKDDLINRITDYLEKIK